MNDKPFIFTLSEHFDEYKYGIDYQKLKFDNAPFSGVRTFYDLSECPEDAIIGRSLFDAGDFLNAVKLGFMIAQNGYTRIAVNHIPWEEEEE